MNDNAVLLHDDCLNALKDIPDNSIDSVVTDPPYGLAFMGKKWDYDVPSVDIWREVLRVLKPGGHALIACGTRTQHRMAVNIEDAGFEIRDVVTWLYGSGFPKSLDVSKAIDKAAGAKREYDYKSTTVSRTVNSASHRGTHICNNCGKFYGSAAANCHCPKSKPATAAAKQWQGFGTALKPACEFWTLARKPLSENTVAANVLKWGTGGLNIDGCRIEAADQAVLDAAVKRMTGNTANAGAFQNSKSIQPNAATGRFPANLLLSCAPTCTEDSHDMFECPIARLDEQSLAGGMHSAGKARPKQANKGDFGITEHGDRVRMADNRFGDTGGASRFFYAAKASKRERNEGCDNNGHPTVKPIALMRYLCRLVTPPGGVVLDPFTGSGSTGVAALNEGFKFIGIEKEQEYYDIVVARIAAASEAKRDKQCA